MPSSQNERGDVMEAYRAWEDDSGARAVIYEGRLSITGKPSMTADDGTVAVGIDLPDDWRGAVEALEQIAALGDTDGAAAPLLVRAGDIATAALRQLGGR